MLDKVKKLFSALYTTVQEALDSKKALAVIGALVVEVFLYTGVELDPEQRAELAKWVMYLVGAYLGAQGLADMGKEKAKVEVEDSEG